VEYARQMGEGGEKWINNLVQKGNPLGDLTKDRITKVK
jgi:hypothetical protein